MASLGNFMFTEEAVSPLKVWQIERCFQNRQQADSHRSDFIGLLHADFVFGQLKDSVRKDPGGGDVVSGAGSARGTTEESDQAH
jgi:hypothetical protein